MSSSPTPEAPQPGGAAADLPRPEHPRPQFQRPTWLSLNGPWRFATGAADDPRFPGGDGYDDEIIVPFCPESTLSGLNDATFRDRFETSLWYHRTLVVPQEWAGGRVVLHFGAVDHDCRVYLDSERVGGHVGGSSSFSIDLTAHVRFGEAHALAVHVHDDPRSGLQAAGKQSTRPASYHVFYTRVTGIWQSVWLESVPTRSIETVRQVADAASGRLTLEPRFAGVAGGDRWRATLSQDGRHVADAEAPALQGVPLTLDVADVRVWSGDDPFLYDLTLELMDERGVVLDSVQSYCGFRTLAWVDGRLLLNGAPLYPRFVLDQGYYPDGIWTAPSDAALRRDIELAIQAGFNGARLHQRAFEERYHYWADRLGFLCWSESASWGLDETQPAAARAFLNEWRELVVQRRNHPSIVAWTPFNESDVDVDPGAHRRLVEETVALTRVLDPTRPVNDCSGWVHVDTDLWTVHAYEQDPEELRRQLTPPPPDPYRNAPELEPPYDGQPYLVDEFGGIKWIPEGEPDRPDDWGYGDDPVSEEEFFRRLAGQVEALLSLPHVAGYCYTQLCDVEQERNGLYAADRSAKFDLERLRAIFGREPGRMR